MSKSGNPRSEADPNCNPAKDPVAIDSMITILHSQDGCARQEARQSLVSMGSVAVPSLLELLSDSSDQARWEAAKALGEIGDPQAAPALVKALEDQNFGVRWLAADGLVALNRDALQPLLHALIEGADSAWLREGAHHVLRMLAVQGLYDQVAPVLVALDDIDPTLEVPEAAEKALEAL